jgi:D-3-phosphoglycerate dehydrogenase
LKVLLTDHHYTDIAAATALIAAAGHELVVGECRSEDAAMTLGRDADAVINQHLPVSARMLDAWPRCRAVAHFGKGVDNIDVAAATRRGIWVTNVPDANHDEVSNHVLAMLLAWARCLLPFDRAAREGRFDYRLAIPRHRLAGQVLGLIGFGAIARCVARKARGLGLDVVAHARHAAGCEVEFALLVDVLRRADYLSIHVPLTPETTGMIGAAQLALMKPTAFLVNTSRGAVVDQRALVEALREGRIAGAGLDVTDPEPPRADDALLALPNVILTPHAAWYSEESREDVTTAAAREVVRVLANGRPASPVNPEVVPRFGVTY